MKNLNYGDYLVFYNENIGAVYCPAKGRIMSTSTLHAKKIKLYLRQYFNNELSIEEEKILENYLHDSFQSYSYLTHIPPEKLLRRKKLKQLEILVTTDCNLNCKYCYAHGGNYNKEPMRLDKNKAILYLKKLLIGRYEEIDAVMFFGGEPTICSATIEGICEFFRENVSAGLLKKMPVFTMVTNATLIDDYMAGIIAKHEIYVTVSVDGPKDIHDKLRVDCVGKGTYEKVEAGIKTLKKYDVVPRMIEATYTKKHKDMGYTRQMIQEYIVKNFGVKQVLIADCEPGGYTDELLINETKQEDSDLLPRQRNFLKLKIMQCLSADTYSDVSCGAGTSSCALLPNGDIYPCHRFAEYPEYRIASYENDFCFQEYDSVLRKLSESYRSVNKECQNCWAKYICTICPASLLLFGQKPSDCDMVRKRAECLILECIGEKKDPIPL